MLRLQRILFYQRNWNFFDTLILDKISFLMVGLTVALRLMIMSLFIDSPNFLFIYLSMILSISFSSKNILLFYIFFELRIIPIFIIIFYKGKQYERLTARLYLLIYTLLASFPFLLFIINSYNSPTVWVLTELNWFYKHNFLFLISYLAFLTKLPIFFLHIWLPKAHVEAPVYGSIILAGVILKLGTYGLIKIIQVYYLNKINITWGVTLLVFFSVISGIICLFSVDLKVIIAISSVSHITFLVSAFFLAELESLRALIINAISHGFISSNIFYILNCSYERIKRRSVFLIKNMNFSTLLNSLILIIIISNFSAPPYLRFFREILLFINFITVNKFIVIFRIFYMIITSFYSLFLFYSLKTNSSVLNTRKDIELKEWNIRIMLVNISLLMVLTIDFFILV